MHSSICGCLFCIPIVIELGIPRAENSDNYRDAEDTKFVYGWRLEQEAALRASKGVGMTQEQVINFVNGYYPAYELYTATLRNGIFGPDDKARQLRLVVGQDRKVKSVETI